MDGAPGRGDASTECLPRKLGVAAGLIGSRPSQYRQAQHKIYSSRWNSSGVFICTPLAMAAHSIATRSSSADSIAREQHMWSLTTPRYLSSECTLRDKATDHS